MSSGQHRGHPFFTTIIVLGVVVLLLIFVGNYIPAYQSLPLSAQSSTTPKVIQAAQITLANLSHGAAAPANNFRQPVKEKMDDLQNGVKEQSDIDKIRNNLNDK